MSKDKIKIIEASYNVEKKIAKIKVKKLDTGESVIWMLTDDSFDALVNQIVGTSLEYYDIQRILLCQKLIGLEMNNKVEIDIDSTNIDEIKDKSIVELKHNHDTFDRYPFYEVSQGIIEESMQKRKKIKVRLFGGGNCEVCSLALLALQNLEDHFDYEYIDAFTDETQDLCDEQKVEELPHLQCLDDNNEVVGNYVGLEVLDVL